MPGITSGWKRKLAIAGAIVLGVLLLRETGMVDLSYYKSEISSQFSASKSMSRSGPRDAEHSWDITIHNGDDEIFAQTILNGTAAPIVVTGDMDIPKFSGNYYTPLFKDFAMTCRLEFAGADEMEMAKTKGEMDIEVTAKIRGFCTRSKAKALAVQRANESVKRYFNEQFET